MAWITPCGLSEKGVTSLEKITGVKHDFDKVTDVIIKLFCEIFEMDFEIITLSELNKITG